MHIRILVSIGAVLASALLPASVLAADNSSVPDPHVAGPDNYRLLLENESVRIYEVNLKPGASVPLHRHPDHVAYVVTGAKLRMTQPGQKPEVLELKTGEVTFLPAQSHAVENVGGTEAKVALVELRKPGMAAPAGNEPHKVDAKIYHKLFENERVRVFEVTFPPGAKIGMHTHPDHAGYVIEGGQLRVTQPVGEPQLFELKAGDGAFLPAQLHQAENTGTTRVRLIVYEVKPAMMSPGK